MNLMFIGGVSGGVFLILGLLSFIFFVLWVITIVNAVQSNFKDPNMKLIWILIILFGNFLGMVLYWIIAPGQKKNDFNQFNHLK
ncbi:Phospholipase_D-nuclease N-terminal [Belliella buryatensis]|uniref:Phospholipase_D-nuclease N-terminal n=1 Tax=Belliella buryatensis TaxID=1500549 RepID=A0A239FU93_9BACT|nr:PLD nuclease N-terminal domain-containing protein [Belliella buryatensis]SNS60390.1 Phospholipase_D-nuclease N-terminal [Belliella buryatensis]